MQPTAALIEAVIYPLASNSWLKELDMNILDLLKKLFAVFAVASMVLACVARPFLLLLNWLPETTNDDGADDEWHTCYSGSVNHGQGPLPGDVRTFFED